jgi:hypothetical protein
MNGHRKGIFADGSEIHDIPFMTGAQAAPREMVEAMLMPNEPPFINRPLTKLQRWDWNRLTHQGVERGSGIASKIIAACAESFLNARDSPGARRHESCL